MVDPVDKGAPDSQTLGYSLLGETVDPVDKGAPDGLWRRWQIWYILKRLCGSA
jgi:hypothetical protein